MALVAPGDTVAIPVGTVVALGDIMVSEMGTVWWHWWHLVTLWPSQWGQWVAVGDIVVSQVGTVGDTGGRCGHPSGDNGWHWGTLWPSQ